MEISSKWLESSLVDSRQEELVLLTYRNRVYWIDSCDHEDNNNDCNNNKDKADNDVDYDVVYDCVT